MDIDTIGGRKTKRSVEEPVQGTIGVPVAANKRRAALSTITNQPISSQVDNFSSALKPNLQEVIFYYFCKHSVKYMNNMQKYTHKLLFICINIF